MTEEELAREFEERARLEEEARRLQDQNQDTQGKDATPAEGEPGIQDQIDMTGPDALLPPELKEEPVIRARVEFDENTGRAVVAFFGASNRESFLHLEYPR